MQMIVATITCVQTEFSCADGGTARRHADSSARSGGGGGGGSSRFRPRRHASGHHELVQLRRSYCCVAVWKATPPKVCGTYASHVNLHNVIAWTCSWCPALIAWPHWPHCHGKRLLPKYVAFHIAMRKSLCALHCVWPYCQLERG